MKKRIIALVIAVGIAMIGISASGQAPDSSDAHATQIVRLSGSITGLLATTEGGCSKGFSNQCPSGHTCGCFTGTGLKVSSRALGKGTANIFATLDNTGAFALGECGPVYMEIDITAEKDSPIFNAIGGVCFEPDGVGVFSGVMGLATTSKLFATGGSAGYTAVLNCTSGLCGGPLIMALRFKGTAK